MTHIHASTSLAALAVRSGRGLAHAQMTLYDLARRYRELGFPETAPNVASIRRAAARHGVDALLVTAIVQAESSFDPRAVSHRGAVGLMQVMPASAGSHGVRLAEPEVNLDVGARYLRRLLERYGGDLELALAAYNAGPGNVRRYGGVPPFRETRRYVEKVLGLYVAYCRAAWHESGAARRLEEL